MNNKQKIKKAVSNLKSLQRNIEYDDWDSYEGKFRSTFTDMLKIHEYNEIISDTINILENGNTVSKLDLDTENSLFSSDQYFNNSHFNSHFNNPFSRLVEKEEKRKRINRALTKASLIISLLTLSLEIYNAKKQ